MSPILILLCARLYPRSNVNSVPIVKLKLISHSIVLPTLFFLFLIQVFPKWQLWSNMEVANLMIWKLVVNDLKWWLFSIHVNIISLFSWLFLYQVTRITDCGDVLSPFSSSSGDGFVHNCVFSPWWTWGHASQNWPTVPDFSGITGMPQQSTILTSLALSSQIASRH